jgi:hypothetical protein
MTRQSKIDFLHGQAPTNVDRVLEKLDPGPKASGRRMRAGSTARTSLKMLPREHELYELMTGSQSDALLVAWCGS